ncbi:MAG: 2-amino-4-hydroxy-6-hydroxymethyldihydropteridine diphosphokinase [Pseudomonadota bacterium]
MPQVFVSIGSNIDRENNIRGALRELRSHYGALVLSRAYESKAEGFTGDNFYNLVVAFDTNEAIEQIKENLRRIEAQFGRERSGNRHGSRTLDLDLLLYGEVVRHDGTVNLPHPDIGRYAFVLRPLAEMAPQQRHPETGQSLAQMWKKFEKSGQKIQAVEVDTGG